MGDGLGKTTGGSIAPCSRIARCRCSPASSTCVSTMPGFHIQVGDQQQCLPVDQVIICAGQEPLKELQAGLQAAGKPVHIIGGADVAAELDAKRAIRQGRSWLPSSSRPTLSYPGQTPEPQGFLHPVLC